MLAASTSPSSLRILASHLLTTFTGKQHRQSTFARWNRLSRIQELRRGYEWSTKTLCQTTCTCFIFFLSTPCCCWTQPRTYVLLATSILTTEQQQQLDKFQQAAESSTTKKQKSNKKNVIQYGILFITR